jgi:hypothetical protein
MVVLPDDLLKEAVPGNIRRGMFAIHRSNI